jgi:2,4-dienoyl-CoA reductase-like NADH-dependent reductase (Old Yellow Enzyme family)
LTTPNLFSPLSFAHGRAMKNRFAVAPMTNYQSHADGRLSDDEYRWLTMRAEGGFGLTMTCGAHVQPIGQGFPGQLGVFSDDLLPGLTRLAQGLKAPGSVAIMQLIHGGVRADKNHIDGPPVGPSDDDATGARALAAAEVEQLVEDFIAAALRAERAGFDGVELHGAHGYILTQFLSEETNQRTDKWGGSLENRARLTREIIAGVRSRCAPGFILGLRLSPERFGIKMDEALALAGELLDEGQLDFLDMSLWDAFKAPNDEAYAEKPLIRWFTDLPRGRTRVGVAGKINSTADAQWCLDQGADFVLLGRAAILHHDFPRRAHDAQFQTIALPVTRDYLAAEGVSPTFLDYLDGWKTILVPVEHAEG